MSTKKRKSGMMAQHTGSTKMIEKEETVLYADVRKQETNDDTNQRDSVARRSIKIRSSPENPPNSRSGRTNKSSPPKEASARDTNASSSDVRLPKNKELAKLVMYASIKLEVPCDDESFLIQQRKSTARPIKKEEFNDNVSILVHGDTNTRYPNKGRSLIEKNNTEIEVPSARTIRGKSVPRGIQAPSVENGVIYTRNVAMDKAPPVNAPSKDAPNRSETIESGQKEIVKAEPLKKEQFECNASMLANPETSPRVTLKRSFSVKKREKRVRRSIRTTPSMDDVATTNAADIHATSAVEESHKATTKRHRLTESSRKESDVPSEEQIAHRDTGVSMNLPASDNISSMSESESSDNDRSSDEDFDPSIKRRKRRSIWDLDSEPDNRNIDRIPSGKNNKRTSGTPDGIQDLPATSTSILSPACKVLSKTKKSSTDHVATSYEQRRFKCDVCDKRFINSSNLRDHNVIHTGKKTFKCGICEKRFTLKSNLQKHIRVHTGEKHLACSFCGKKFGDGSDFVKHKRIHTGEKPYVCTFCDRRFIQNCHLQRHNRTHTGEKPFACSICNRRFSQSSSLRTHERTHTGERPYACSICNKRFAHDSSLLRHKRNHRETSTEDIPNVTQESMGQPSSKESSNLQDNAGNQKIRYISKPIENIVEKMANRNPDTFHLVWSKKFSMELASAVSQSGRNCLLIVKKFKPASFPDVLSLSKMLHTFSIEIGPSAKPFRLFSFGGMVVPEKIIHNNGFKSLAKLESKLNKFARSQGTGIVNIFKHSKDNKGWYESLRSNLKEDCVIANKA